MTTTRLFTVGDAAELCALFVANRDFLRPFQPTRTEEFFTVTQQEERLRSSLAAYESGASVPLAIQDADGAIVGALTVNGITRGALLSAALGYWVSEDANGRGFATAAVGEAIRLAFDELGLHRLQAETLLDNVRSQRVLAKHGFEQFGVATQYLRLDGLWQDHAMFQLINSD